MTTTIGRVLAQVEIRDECWLWTGNKLPTGYGRLSVNGRVERVHRVAYEILVGPIGPGLVLDHECHNAAAAVGACDGGWSCPHRACVNPDHLAQRTRGDNIRASALRGGLWRRSLTHCKHGHEFTPENIYSHGGRRHCRTCRGVSDRKRKAER